MPKRDFNKIEKQKELIKQLQIFHKHVEFTPLFPLRMSFFPTRNLSCISPNSSRGDDLLLSWNWTKYVHPISCLPFLSVACYFTMNDEQFTLQWNYLNLWRLPLCFIENFRQVDSCRKSRLVQDQLKWTSCIICGESSKPYDAQIASCKCSWDFKSE